MIKIIKSIALFTLLILTTIIFNIDVIEHAGAVHLSSDDRHSVFTIFIYIVLYIILLFITFSVNSHRYNDADDMVRCMVVFGMIVPMVFIAMFVRSCTDAILHKYDINTNPKCETAIKEDRLPQAGDYPNGTCYESTSNKRKRELRKRNILE